MALEKNILEKATNHGFQKGMSDAKKFKPKKPIKGWLVIKSLINRAYVNAYKQSYNSGYDFIVHQRSKQQNDYINKNIQQELEKQEKEKEQKKLNIQKDVPNINIEARLKILSQALEAEREKNMDYEKDT